MEVTPPQQMRSWLDLLPAPYDQDPIVVVVLCPEGAKYRVRTGKDIISHKDLKVGFLVHEEREAALQVLDPVVDSYFTHRDILKANKISMAYPCHIGLLSDIPQAFLTDDGLKPLLFLRDNMSDDYFSLRDFLCKLKTQETN